MLFQLTTLGSKTAIANGDIVDLHNRNGDITVQNEDLVTPGCVARLDAIHKNMVSTELNTYLQSVIISCSEVIALSSYPALPTGTGSELASSWYATFKLLHFNV